MKSSFLVCVVAVFITLFHSGAAESYTLAENYYMEASFVIPDEGVSVDVNTYVDNDAGAQLQNYSTPNGAYTQLLIVNKAYPVNSTLYNYFLEENVMTCYTFFPVPVRYPFPQVPLPLGDLIGLARMQGRLVQSYAENVGRYVRHKFTDVALRKSIADPFHYMSTNEEAMSTVETSTVHNNSMVNPSIFAVPTACGPSSSHNHIVELPAESVQDIMSQSPTIEWFSSVTKRLLYAPLKQPGAIDALLSEARQELGRHFQPFVSQGMSLGPNASADFSPYATYIRDQGRCGACWAFSSAAATEIVWNRLHNHLPAQVPTAKDWFSPQLLLDCVHGNPKNISVIQCKGCLGGWPLTGLSHIVRKGINRDVDYPFDSANGFVCKQGTGSMPPSEFPLAGAGYIPYSITPAVNEPLLMEAVVTHGAVIAVMNADPTLFYGGGYIFNSTCPPNFGHAVVIVGFGTDPASGMNYWKIKNSFGAAWGEGGYFRIQRGINLCGVEQMGFIPYAA